MLTLYDTVGGSEVSLLDAGREVEIYHVGFAAATGKLMFDGLRFADNAYVVGEVDLGTRQVSIVPSGSSKLVDFQTF